MHRSFPPPPPFSANPKHVMNDPHANETLSGHTLAPVSDLQDYGASIIAELDRADAELHNPANQPFSALTAHVLTDMAALRERQFDMFRRHVEIEQNYKIENASADGNNVQRMSFSAIAKTMRKKESETAGLLDKLADFDNQLRLVVDNIEGSGRAAHAGEPQPPRNAASSVRRLDSASHGENA